jgi:osmotically-inducible protein OsmY
MDVTNKYNVVTLTGVVENCMKKSEAADAAKIITGVKKSDWKN